MVIASHVIFSAYGFWLPNDERGSWSDFVRRWELLRFDPATNVHTRRSVAGRAFDWRKRDAAKAALLHPAVVFTGVQALFVARAFADGVRRSGFVILACAILPDHVHLVLGRHEYDVEQVINRLKGAATRELSGAGLHPLDGHRTKENGVPSPWAAGLWKVFLNAAEDVRRSVEYVRNNPVKEGHKPQTWPFVTRWESWGVANYPTLFSGSPEGRA